MSETPGNLFGGAAAAQTGLDVVPQPRVQQFARPPRLEATRAVALVCAVQARYGWPRALRTCSRLTVLRARPNTVAIVRNE